jgi:hypothetical protein
METGTHILIMKRKIKQEGNFELTLETFVGHANLYMVNSQAIILRISVGDCD